MPATGTPDHNHSTEPRGTLDSPNTEAHWPKDYDPAGDVGKSRPSGNPTDRDFAF